METQTTDTNGADAANADANAATNSILNSTPAAPEATTGANGNDAPSSSDGQNTQTNGSTETASGQSNGTEQKAADIDWRHDFAQGLDDKDKEAWLNESARSENKQALAKRFLDMRRSQSNAITIPSEDDPERESKMGDIYSKLGRPESADKYQLNWDGPEPLSESELAAFEEYKQVHYRNGGTQKSLDESVKWESQQRKVQMEAWRAKAEDTEAERMATLKGVWGQDFDQNAQVYKHTVGHYMGNDVEQFAQMRLEDGTLVSNHPVIARAFAKVGRERASDDFDYTPMNADRKESAQDELKALQAEMIEKKLRPGMPGYPSEKFDELYAAAASTRGRTPNDRFRRTA